MKPSVLAAVVTLGLSPLAARAQAADPAPAAPWSLGAGLGWSVYGTTFLNPGSALLVPGAPTVRTSLERALAPAWWLEVGLAATAGRQRGEAPEGSGAVTRNDQASAALTLGLRRALTRPGAPVCVSVDLALVAGLSGSHVDQAYSPPVTSRTEAASLGLVAGLAVERELSGGLSLRVGTSLAGAGWSRGSTERSSAGKVTLQGGNASLVLAPWLELRQAF